jgi:hypothetical protein
VAAIVVRVYGESGAVVAEDVQLEAGVPVRLAGPTIELVSVDEQLVDEQPAVTTATTEDLDHSDAFALDAGAGERRVD